MRLLYREVVRFEVLRYDDRASARPWRTPHWFALGLITVTFLAFIFAPWPLMDKLRAVGFAVCPQRPAHSLFVDGVQLPLEARKVGIYLGFLSALVYLLALGRGRAVRLPRWPIGRILAGFVVLMGVDGLNALFYDLGWPHLYLPDNRLRLATGLFNGLAVAALALPVVNASLWSKGEPRRSLESWRELLAAATVQATVFLVVISGAPFFLYPVAALCIVGAVAMLSTVNALLLVGVIRRPSRIDASADVFPIVAIALVLDGFELAAMAAVRLLLVGTAAL